MPEDIYLEVMLVIRASLLFAEETAHLHFLLERISPMGPKHSSWATMVGGAETDSLVRIVQRGESQHVAYHLFNVRLAARRETERSILLGARALANLRFQVKETAPPSKIFSYSVRSANGFGVS